MLYDNPKRKKSWIKSGQPMTSTVKPKIHTKKVTTHLMRHEKSMVYYKLNSGETVTAECYQ